MSKISLAKGAAYLKNISYSQLEALYKREKPGKSRERLQAALLRKKGKILKEIACALGRGVSTIYRWLYSMEHEGVEHRHDRKRPGRPRTLNPTQEKAIEGDLDKPPSECGFKRGSWNSKMIVKRIFDRFNIPYSRSSALRLASRLGFSTRKPRPIPYNSATPEEQKEFIENAKTTIARWHAEGRHVAAVDACTLRDSPASRRGLRRRGGYDTVSINYSKKSTHVFGALGENTLKIHFPDGLSSKEYIEFLEDLVDTYRKVGIVCDNASALTCKDMKDHIVKMNGSVEMLHIPPHTPQLNPIEIQWREIKVGIADLFFGDMDKMKKTIKQMLDDKEIPIVKLFDWLLPP